jgi:hypothetical protein
MIATPRGSDGWIVRGFHAIACDRGAIEVVGDNIVARIRTLAAVIRIPGVRMWIIAVMTATPRGSDG